MAEHGVQGDELVGGTLQQEHGAFEVQADAGECASPATSRPPRRRHCSKAEAIFKIGFVHAQHDLGLFELKASERTISRQPDFRLRPVCPPPRSSRCGFAGPGRAGAVRVMVDEGGKSKGSDPSLPALTAERQEEQSEGSDPSCCPSNRQFVRPKFVGRAAPLCRRSVLCRRHRRSTGNAYPAQ